MKTSTASASRGAPRPRRTESPRRRIALPIREARRLYAEELRHCAGVRSELVIQAFASVPRERFLSPGPWTLLPASRPDRAFTTPDADPRRLYHNVLVPIDASRHLNNGEPALWAHLMDQLELQRGQRVLHIGAGTGYYSAILAEIVGRGGEVVAIEVDPMLAARAQLNLARWKQARVIAANGFTHEPDPADAIVVNAGVTEIAPAWLDALEETGRLLVPLTLDEGTPRPGWGAYLMVQRRGWRYSVGLASRVGIFPCIGGRDPKAGERLRGALRNSDWSQIRSLRRPPEVPDESCWLRCEGYWLSTAPAE
jgi:protein-L-isoaspartate(D-aspartate) O-methyltransferase